MHMESNDGMFWLLSKKYRKFSYSMGNLHTSLKWQTIYTGDLGTQWEIFVLAWNGKQFKPGSKDETFFPLRVWPENGATLGQSFHQGFNSFFLQYFLSS